MNYPKEKVCNITNSNNKLQVSIDRCLAFGMTGYREEINSLRKLANRLGEQTELYQKL
jgi:hypothetical protein